MGQPPHRRVWYHGSRDQFEGFSPERAGRTRDLSAHLGFHFSSREETAWNFATFLYRGQGDSREGWLYACRLNIRKPLQVGRERDFAYSLLDFGVAQGILPANLMSMSAADFGVPPNDLGSGLSSGVWGDFSVRVGLYGATARLAQSYLQHLRERGYDSILYGNTHEKEFTVYGEATALVFDFSRIEILDRVPASTKRWHVWRHQALLGATGRLKGATVAPAPISDAPVQTAEPAEALGL